MVPGEEVREYFCVKQMQCWQPRTEMIMNGEKKTLKKH
jgi:hypothetical protein